MSTSRRSPDLRQGMQGQDTLHNRAVFKQIWRKLCGFKASFWGEFILGFLAILLINCIVYIGFFLSVVLTKTVINHGALLPFVSVLYFIASFIFIIFEKVLNALFFISLTYFSLQWLRNQPLKVTHIFAFRHHWKRLIGLALIFILITSLFSLVKIISLGSSSLLFLLNTSSANIFTWFSFFIWLSFCLFFITLFFFTFLYCLLLFSFAALLCFDKKTTDIKTSLQVAFKALNAQLTSHLLLFLLAILIFMFGVFFTLGVAVIWLLPWFFLVIAWQYQTIFGENTHEMSEDEKSSAVVT